MPINPTYWKDLICEIILRNPLDVSGSMPLPGEKDSSVCLSSTPTVAQFGKNPNTHYPIPASLLPKEDPFDHHIIIFDSFNNNELSK